MQFVEKASNAKQNASVDEIGWFKNTTKYKYLINDRGFDGRLITSLIHSNKFKTQFYK
jgi:hypothetical protein